MRPSEARWPLLQGVHLENIATAWAAIDAETVDRPEFRERLAQLKTTADTQFPGTVFAREVRLKPQ